MDKDKFAACILGGSIGDAWGSSYEGDVQEDDQTTYYLGAKPIKNRDWKITDDTQMTLATCEVLSEGSFNSELLAYKFLEYYKRNKLTGLGASTLKAILDLEMGIHYSQVGRRGEFAAGNGVAMRIAPFAFFDSITREDIYLASSITHKNDEAYAGALAVYKVLRIIIEGEWTGSGNLLDILIPYLPDTNVRDRLIELCKSYQSKTITALAKVGNNGYVVNSVPFAICSATKVLELGFEEMINQIVSSGGDTDTNASIAGQIAGTLIGTQKIPQSLLSKLKSLSSFPWIEQTIAKTVHKKSSNG